MCLCIQNIQEKQATFIKRNEFLSRKLQSIHTLLDLKNVVSEKLAISDINTRTLYLMLESMVTQKHYLCELFPHIKS